MGPVAACRSPLWSLERPSVAESGTSEKCLKLTSLCSTPNPSQIPCYRDLEAFHKSAEFRLVANRVNSGRVVYLPEQAAM